MPFNDIDKTWLDDFNVASGHMSKCREFHVATIRSWVYE